VPEKGDDPRNFHAHLLMTMRQASPLGLRRVKTRAWNSETMLLKWRKSWASRQNEALRRHGKEARVDHRSLAAQKELALSRRDRASAVLLTRLPEIHVGPNVRVAPSITPHSQDRPAGPLRKREEGRARRVVLHSQLDRSSRGSFNVSRLRLNAE